MGLLLDHAQDKIVLLDEEGRFTYANAAVERTLGWEPAGLLGKRAFDFIHPDDVETVRAVFERTLGSDTFSEAVTEYRFRARDGSWVWLESRMSNLTDETLDGYVVSSRDVTDRVEAQRESEETSRRLQEIAGTTSEVLWLFDGDFSEVLFVNDAYEDVYGRPAEELEASPTAFLDVIHPDDVPAVREAIECLSAGHPVDIEYRVNPQLGYNVWLWVQAQPIVEDGETVRVAGFSRDVTDRKRRVRQLYTMDNLLRHNLRNDLNVILGQADLIDERTDEVADLTAVVRRTGEDLLASAEKEREIIDLLTADPAPTRVDLVNAVSNALEEVQHRYPDARIDLSTPDAVPVHALKQVSLALVELVENAVVYHAGERPSVRVSVELDDEEAVVTVEDRGISFPELESRVLVGDHEVDRVYHSSGLGLWLVYWVVQLSHGHIDVDTGPEKGNRVRLHLPRVDTADDARSE